MSSPVAWVSLSGACDNRPELFTYTMGTGHWSPLHAQGCAEVKAGQKEGKCPSGSSEDAGTMLLSHPELFSLCSSWPVGPAQREPLPRQLPPPCSVSSGSSQHPLTSSYAFIGVSGLLSPPKPGSPHLGGWGQIIPCCEVLSLAAQG